MKKKSVIILLSIIFIVSALEINISRNCEAGLIGIAATAASAYFHPSGILALITVALVTLIAAVFASWRTNKEKNFRLLLELGREKNKMEQSFRESEQRYRMLFQSNIAGFALHEIICDEQGAGVDYRFLEINPAFMTLTGLKADCIIGKKITEILPQIEQCWIDRYVKVAMTGEAVHFEYYSKELEKYFEVTAYSPKKMQFATVFLDITEKKRFELEQTRIQKLESLGVLAGGIAHDFNNILMGIMGYASLAAMDGGEIQTAVYEKIMVATKRASALTQQLLEYAKCDQPYIKAIDVANITKDVADFALHGTNSRYLAIFPKDLYLIEADPIQIGRAIQNLVANAAQAMIEGGMIRIDGGNVELSSDNPLNLPSGKYVHLSVSDEGMGIPEENLSKIFEPYFSTKNQYGAGSGLGLAIAASFVQKHGGKITVKSEVGLGTTFNIYLPASEKNGVMEVVDMKVQEPSGRELKVLVMDDDETIRTFLVRAVERIGHSVVTASHGVEALEKYCAAIDAESPFDLVIFDLTIPCGMGGEETMKKVLDINSEAIGIVSSGYAGQLPKGFKAALSKPYTVKDLKNIIDEICRA